MDLLTFDEIDMTTFILILFTGAILWYFFKQKNPEKQVSPTKPEPQEIVFRIQVETSYRAPDNEAPVDKDAWEDWDTNQYAPGMPEHKLEGVHLHISYVDREGSVTQRDVDIKKYVYNPETGAGVLYAFCHLRQANRPFVFVRIRQASDPKTGEIIANIGQHLDRTYQATSRYAVEQFMKEHDAAMFVLFSLAKADGVLRAKERSIILQWAALHGLTQEQALLTLEDQMKGWYFTKHSFYEAVKTVKNQSRPEGYMQSLWSIMQAIAASDKTQHPDETQLLSYAARQWTTAVRLLDAIAQPADKNGTDD